jgi:hypothetical protein
MIVVHFYDKNVELLNQLRNNAPSEGDQVVIKGRKGTILSVQPINDKHVNVLVELEVIKKPTFTIDPKKKRR